MHISFFFFFFSAFESGTRFDSSDLSFCCSNETPSKHPSSELRPWKGYIIHLHQPPGAAHDLRDGWNKSCISVFYRSQSKTRGGKQKIFFPATAPHLVGGKAWPFTFSSWVIHSRFGMWSRYRFFFLPFGCHFGFLVCLDGFVYAWKQNYRTVSSLLQHVEAGCRASAVSR